MSATVRILVADDHEMVRRGIRSLLAERSDWLVCGEAVNGREAVERAIELRPHVVIMDVTMPLLSGLEATRRIRKALPECEVLILTMHESEQLIREVLAAGARGYLLKADAGQLVVNAVEALAAHQPFFTSRVSQVLLGNFLGQDGTAAAEPAEGATLTSRETEVVQLVAEGRSSKEAAAVLGISDQTVETHRANAMRKLGIHSVSELVRYAVRNRLVNP
jgi:DNA-binding NarL/FixJ family response regulator